MPRRRSVRIKLRKITVGTDNIGNPTETAVITEVYATKNSITQNAFFNSLQHNLKLDYKFIIRTNVYDQQSEIEFNNIIYTVVRTYEKSIDFIELFVSVKRGNAK